MRRIVARFFIHPDKKEDFIRDLKPVVEAVRREEGNLEYTVFFDSANDAFVFIEAFRDEQAHMEHRKSEHFVKLFPKLSQYLRQPHQVEIYDDQVY